MKIAESYFRINGSYETLLEVLSAETAAVFSDHSKTIMKVYN
jgi:hypothetical protein